MTTKKKAANGQVLPKGITQLANGRYQGRIYYNGCRYALYDDDIKKLQKAMIDKRYELEHGLCGKADNVTFNEWFNTFIEDYKTDKVRDTTITLYKTLYDTHIKAAIGSIQLSKIKAHHIQRLINNMARQKGKRKPYKHSTIESVKTIIGMTLRQAVKNELITNNPCAAVTLPPNDEKHHEALTPEQQREFLKYAYQQYQGGPRYALYLTGFYTGLRIGEIMALTWNDIDLTKGLIYVRHTLIQKPGNKYELHEPKTKDSKRIVPLTDQLRSALERIKPIADTQKDIIKLKARAKQQTDFVFYGKGSIPKHQKARGMIIEDLKLYSEWERQQAAAENRDNIEIGYFTAHCMRHSFASRCFELGIPPKVVQGYLGHSSISMTMDIYTHVMDNVNVVEIQKLAAL